MKMVITFQTGNTNKTCEVMLSEETMKKCAERFLALRLQSYYRLAEPVDFGTLEICDSMVKFKEL